MDKTQSQNKIAALNKRKQELTNLIEKAQEASEILSQKKMDKIGTYINQTEKEDFENKQQLDKEQNYLNSNEMGNNESQNEEIKKMQRKIQRDFARQEAKIGKPDKEFEEYKEEETKIEKNPFINYKKQYKNRIDYETDRKQILSKKVGNLLDALFSKREENIKRRETNRNHFMENDNKLRVKTVPEDNVEKDEAIMEKIAQLLKNNKINEIIVSGGEKKLAQAEKERLFSEEEKKEGLDKNMEDRVITWGQDLDTKMALWLLNDFNKKGEVGEIYQEGARSTILDTRGKEKEPKEMIEGIRVFLDAGGTWIKIENKGDTTTINLDHHGVGQRAPTSGTKMVYQIMEKADLLKDKPEWLEKLVGLINNVDNLIYLEDKGKNGEKIFNENYFRNEWPNSLYALAEKDIPFETLLELCKSGKIKDPSVPFTTKELNGEVGKIKIDGCTIKELCEKQKKNVENVLARIKNAEKINEKSGLNLNTKSLGKIIYHNYPKNEKGALINMIPDHLAFKATKAKGFDTYIAWNQQGNKFFINSNNPNLSKIVEELNKADPDCAIDVRGVMVFGKIKNLTEEQFLNIIDPKILRGEEGKETPQAESGLTLEEEKILADAEEKIKDADKEIAEAKEKLEKLYAELKTAQFREKKEAKEKAANKKVKTDKKVDEEEGKPNVIMENNDKIKSFSPDFIKEKITGLLLGIKQVKNIDKLEIEGSGNKIEINTSLKAKEGIISVKVNIDLTLIDKDGEIIVQDYRVDAGALTSIVKPLITKQLGNVTKLIKEYIEKEEKEKNKKVGKIWIEDGQLKAL